ncbi:MAG: tagaturonate reductase [Gemmataceae bacterium]
MAETILQFGTGRFLRGFADFFVHEANEAGQNVGSIVVVQSTAGSRAEGLKGSDGYHLALRGYEEGQVIDRTLKIRSISRALEAGKEWAAVLEFAASPTLKWIWSNTTEVGLALDEQDKLTDDPPRSYPAKLTRVLWARFQAGRPGVPVLPCELIENNGVVLHGLVRDQANRWKLPADFLSWLETECTWLNSLVDRMVLGPPTDHPMVGKDSMLIMGEPYALWGIEKPKNRPFDFIKHPKIEIVDDLTAYYLRKVRILNGIHTAMVGKFMPKGFETVQQVMKDSAALDWVLGLLYEEIVPTIAYRVPDVARFARQTLDRFQNPFLAHKLSDIAAKHEAKRKVRLETTISEYEKLFGKKPVKLLEAIAFTPG